jgi:hypothetical protein
MQSDIEIYVKNIAASAVEQWLQAMGWQTDASILNRTTTKIIASTSDKSFTVLAVSSGKFTSIWFQSDQTPWANDVDCAKQAWQHFGKEVRASQGGWLEDNKDDRWWKLDDSGEALIDWSGY